LLNGDLTGGAVTRPQRAIVRYQGVYRYGDRAAAWLTLHAAHRPRGLQGTPALRRPLPRYRR